MGPVVPGYDVVAEIGRGASSVVYLARRLDLGGRRVALKVIDTDEQGRASLERFNEERMTRAAVSAHPALLTVFSSGRTGEGQPYLVVELMAGSLGAWLERHGTMAWSDAAHVGVTLAEALSELHHAALLHRAVSPDKLWYDRVGRVALDAFCLAPDRLEEHDGGALRSGADAPEVRWNECHHSAGDVFGLGSTLWHLITGEPPPPCGPADPGQDGAAPMGGPESGSGTDPGLDPDVGEATDPLGQLMTNGVPPQLVSLISRCLEADPALRPELPTVLEALLGILGEAAGERRLPVDQATLPPWLPAQDPAPGEAVGGGPPVSSQRNETEEPGPAAPPIRAGGDALGQVTVAEVEGPDLEALPGPAAMVAGRIRRRHGGAHRKAVLGAGAVLSAVAILTGLVMTASEDGPVRTVGNVGGAGSPAVSYELPLPIGMDPGLPSTLSGWEERWRQERAAVVATIRTAGYGVAADGRSALISENLRIDLSTCPEGWNNGAGLTDASVRIGITGYDQVDGPRPEAVDITSIMDGLRRYFEPVDRGTIVPQTGTARTVALVGFESAPGSATPATPWLMGVEDVLGMITLGHESTVGSLADLNDRCVPQPLAQQPSAATGDPLGHPWSTGLERTWRTEAALWGQLIQQRADELRGPDGTITVGALVAASSAVGFDLDAGFRAWLAQSPMAAEVNYQPQMLDLRIPVTVDWFGDLAAVNPDVVLLMAAGSRCAEGVLEAERYGLSGLSNANGARDCCSCRVDARAPSPRTCWRTVAIRPRSAAGGWSTAGSRTNGPTAPPTSGPTTSPPAWVTWTRWQRTAPPAWDGHWSRSCASPRNWRAVSPGST